MRSARPGHPRRTFSRRPSSRAAGFRAEPLEPRRLLSVAISEPYESAASGNRAGFFADFTSDERPTEVVASWGDGAVEGLLASEPVGPGAVDLDMIEYDPATRRGTVYGLHDYADAGRYAVTLTVKGDGGTTDSATFFADVAAPANADDCGCGADAGDFASADTTSTDASETFHASGATATVTDAVLSEEAFGTLDVTQVFVNGPTVTNGSAGFKAAAGVDATFGYAVPGGTVQTRPLSWVGGINAVSIRFSRDVAAQLAQGDLAVTGWVGNATATALPTTGFTYDAATRTGTWTFADVTRSKLRFILNDDEATGILGLDGEWTNPTEGVPGPCGNGSTGGDSYPSGNGTSGGDFNFRVNVLHGDVSGDGVVNAIDVAEVKRRLTRRPNDGVTDPLRMYTIFSDITGDGVVNSNDLAQVKGRLTQRINDPVDPGTGEIDIDVATISHNAETGVLPEADEDGKGAFIPINNDDDDYDTDNKPDMDQQGAIPGETDLLPIYLRKYVPPGGPQRSEYTLDFPQELRIWKKPDRTDPVTSGATVFPTDVETKLYVEAVEPADRVSIDLNWTGRDCSINDAGWIVVTAFYWNGPLNVPGNSIHNYIASGAPPASGWQFGDGVIKSGYDTSDMTILAGAGPKVEKRVYKVNDSYTWDLEVNVVEVTVAAPAAGAAFTPGTPTNHDNVVLPNGVLRKYVRAGVSRPQDPPQNPGLKWGARVTLNGPNNNRGVKFMVTGFIQNAIGYENRGVYTSGRSLRSSKAGTMSSTTPVLDAGAGRPWYVKGLGGVPSKIDNWDPTAPAGNTREIGDWDTPYGGPPLTWNQGGQVAPGDDLLATMTYVNTFSLNVCVQTKDTRQNAHQVYTRRATAQWTFNGSGTIANVAPYIWRNAGVAAVSAPAGWTSVTDGSSPKTDGNLANQELATETFA